MEGFKVKDIMHGITVISPKASVTEAASIMDSKDIGSLLVEENGKMIGIITERDVVKVVANGDKPDHVKVSEVMASKLQTIDANADIIEASEIMKIHHIRRLPVVENGKFVGMITARGVGESVHEFYVNIIEKNLKKILRKVEK